MSVLEGGQSRLEESRIKELHGYHNVMASAQSDFAFFASGITLSECVVAHHLPFIGLQVFKIVVLKL